MSYIIDTEPVWEHLLAVEAGRKMVPVEGEVPPGMFPERPEPMEISLSVDVVRALCQAADITERMRQLLSEALERERAANERLKVVEELLCRIRT